MAILLAAPIGAGKSTVADALAKMTGLEVIYESVEDNPVLPLYYQDRKRYGFHLQMYFLQRRVKDLMHGYATETPKHPVISDRSIVEDKDIFAKQLFETGMMNETEYKIYIDSANTSMTLLDAYRQTHSQNQQEDLLIFLNPSFERTLDQIKQRGRDFEQVDDNPELKEYYLDIYSRYQDWFKTYHRSPKIMIDDYSTDTPADMDKLYQTILQKTKEINYNI